MHTYMRGGLPSQNATQPTLFPATPALLFVCQRSSTLDLTPQGRNIPKTKDAGSQEFLQPLASLLGVSIAATQAAGACVSVDRSV